MVRKGSKVLLVLQVQAVFYFRKDDVVYGFCQKKFVPQYSGRIFYSFVLEYVHHMLLFVFFAYYTEISAFLPCTVFHEDFLWKIF